MSRPLVLLEAPRGARGDVLRVSISDYRGHRYADVRVWFPDSQGGLLPGKGVTLKADAIPAVIEALQQARAELADDET